MIFLQTLHTVFRGGCADLQPHRRFRQDAHVTWGQRRGLPAPLRCSHRSASPETPGIQRGEWLWADPLGLSVPMPRWAGGPVVTCRWPCSLYREAGPVWTRGAWRPALWRGQNTPNLPAALGPGASPTACHAHAPRSPLVLPQGSLRVWTDRHSLCLLQACGRGQQLVPSALRQQRPAPRVGTGWEAGRRLGRARSPSPVRSRRRGQRSGWRSSWGQTPRPQCCDTSAPLRGGAFGGLFFPVYFFNHHAAIWL